MRRAGLVPERLDIVRRAMRLPNTFLGGRVRSGRRSSAREDMRDR